MNDTVTKNAIGVIPARWGSTRFPGKPLTLIAGKPLLTRVIEGARTSQKLREIFVATDDERIANLALDSRIRPIMTDSNLPTGTDRIWQAARWLEAEIIVNIQGDEPLVNGDILDRLIEPLEADPTLEMATLGRPLTMESLQSLNTAKIVVNHRGDALYFSRLPIPFSRSSPATQADLSGAFKHIGIYAYRRSFLERYCAQAPTSLENFEGLEQLRALFMGARIRVVEVDHDSWGVDTPEDVQKIEKLIQEAATRSRIVKGPKP